MILILLLLIEWASLFALLCQNSTKFEDTPIAVSANTTKEQADTLTIP
jgi:hypothetical protein